MDKNEVIILKNIHKNFKVYKDKSQTIKEKLIAKSRSKHAKLNVLNGISFTINRREVVGLIGENGCGKSTALKLISRIMYPDQGTVEIKGRVSSLLELGAGFHPELSGRENIYINASIFGLSKKETDDRLRNIIDFSELWDFIDNPVRTYSSGMYMRLAFSVAINVDADILLIDEILAVGDKNFQEKCFNRLKELKKQGVTIIIVTHDTTMVENFCSRAIWLNKGSVAADGGTELVVNAYLEYMFEKQLLMDKRQEEEQLKAELERKDYTTEDIIELYKKYLIRIPESETVITSYIKTFDKKRDIENSIKNSPEYRALIIMQRQSSENKASEGLSREMVINAYRTCLNRDPESEFAIDNCRMAFSNVDDLLKSLKNSPEYRLINAKNIQNAELITSRSEENKIFEGELAKAVQITDVRIAGQDSESNKNLTYGQSMEIAILYEVKIPKNKYIIDIGIYTEDGYLCCNFNTKNDLVEVTDLLHTGTISCHLPSFPLFAGKYKFYTSILDENENLLDTHRQSELVSVEYAEDAPVKILHTWAIDVNMQALA